MIDKSLLTAALEGLELQKQRIDEQIQEVKQQLGAKTTATSTSAAPAKKTRKRVLSAVARKRIAAAQKKRWAEYRKQKQTD